MTAEPGAVAKVFGHVTGAFFDESALVRDLGRRWLIMEPFLKIASSCRETQGALAALEKLLEEGPVAPEAVDHIRVTTFASAAALAGTHPTSPIGGRFSIPYVVAVRLVTGHAWIDAFDPKRIADPGILALSARVSVSEDPAFTARLPQQRICRIALRETDGTTRYGEVFSTPGDPGNPLPEGALAEKFLRMTGGKAKAWQALCANAVADYATLLGLLK